MFKKNLIDDFMPEIVNGKTFFQAYNSFMNAFRIHCILWLFILDKIYRVSAWNGIFEIVVFYSYDF